MSDEADIRGVIPPYYIFIMKQLEQIAYAEIQKNYVLALEIALNTGKYLPNKLKNKIIPEITRINARIENETKVSGHFQNTMKREAENAKYKIAIQEEQKLVNTLTSLLDEENLLTQKYGAQPLSKTKPHITSGSP